MLGLKLIHGDKTGPQEESTAFLNNHVHGSRL